MAGERKCANCGTPVGVLVDVCPSCGADPDLQLLELGVGAGRKRRPDEPSRRRRPGIGWKRWTPIVALAVVVWGFLVLTSGDDGDDPQAGVAEEEPPKTEASEPRRTIPTRRTPRTTTTTTPLVDQAPLLGEATGLTLLLNGNDTQVLDLDTGVLTRVPVSSRPIAAADGRLLVINDSGQIAWWAAPYDGTDGEVISTQMANSGVWVDPDGSIIWTLVYQPPDGGIVLRALRFDGELVAEMDVPFGVNPIGAMGDDLLLDAPGGAFLQSLDGETTMLSTGRPMAVTEGLAVVSRCEGRLECVTEVVDAEGEVRSRSVLAQYSYMAMYGVGSPVSASGQVAEIVPNSTGTQLRIDGLPIPTVGSNYSGGITWSPDGRWVFASTERSGLVAVDVETGTPRLLFESRSQGGFYGILAMEGIPLEP